MSPGDRPPTDALAMGRVFENELSRRELLRGAAALSAAGVLASCGGSSTSATTTTAALQPKRGGLLRLAMIGGGQAESFDPGKVGLSADAGAARAANLYDTLVFLKPDLTGYTLGLAESIEP